MPVLVLVLVRSSVKLLCVSVALLCGFDVVTITGKHTWVPHDTVPPTLETWNYYLMTVLISRPEAG